MNVNRIIAEQYGFNITEDKKGAFIRSIVGTLRRKFEELRETAFLSFLIFHMQIADYLLYSELTSCLYIT